MNARRQSTLAASEEARNDLGKPPRTQSDSVRLGPTSSTAGIKGTDSSTGRRQMNPSP